NSKFCAAEYFFMSSSDRLNGSTFGGTSMVSTLGANTCAGAPAHRPPTNNTAAQNRRNNNVFSPFARLWRFPADGPGQAWLSVNCGIRGYRYPLVPAEAGTQGPGGVSPFVVAPGFRPSRE